MMKSVVAAAVLATTATAVNISSGVAFPTIPVTVPEDCAGITVVYTTEVAGGKFFSQVTKVDGEGEPTELTLAEANACATAIVSTWVAATAPATADEACFDATAVKWGATAACPIPAGQVCVEGDACAEVADCKVDATTAANSYCPFTKPTGKVLKATTNYGSLKYDDEKFVELAKKVVIPDACKDVLAVGSYVSNKKGTQAVGVTQYKDAACKQADLKTAFEKAVADYNTEAEAENKVSVSYSFKEEDMSVYATCFDDKVGSFVNVSKVATCPILLNPTAACEEDKQCGSGVCAEDVAPEPVVAAEGDKKCQISASFTAFAAPVIAAVVALALF